MSRIRSLSLAAKLNIALLAFFIALSAATVAILLYGFNRTRDNADARSSEALERGGELALRAVAGGAAEQGGILFESAAEVGRRSALYVEAASVVPDASASIPPLTQAASGHYYDPSPDRVTDVVVLSSSSPDDPLVRDDIAFSAPLEAIFPVLLQSFEGEVSGRNFDPTSIVFVSPSGVARYYPPAGIQDLLPVEIDLQEPLMSLGPEQNPDRQTIWTAPYEDLAGQGLVVTARTPVYVGDTFRGSVELDVPLANIIAQIDQLKPTPGGFAFYVDSEGTLVRSNVFDRLTAESATNRELATVLEDIASTEAGDFGSQAVRMQLEGQDYYLAYAQVPGLGGTLAAAAPVSDITAAAAPIASGIDDEATRTLQVMLVAMAVLFVLGLLAAGVLNRTAVVRPINSLVSAARAVGAGDLNARVDVGSGGDELTELGVAFNSMVDQLRESERALEERVDQRTRELQALLDTSKALSSTLELEQLLDDILNHLQALIDCDGAAVLLVEGDELVQLAVRRPQSMAVDTAPVGNTAQAYSAIWKTIERGEPVVIDDVRDDTPMAQAYRGQLHVDLDLTPVAYVRAWAAVPLTARDQVIGMLAIAHKKPGSFDQRDIELATAVAAQAAVAIENARLFEEAVQRTNEVNALLVADAELHRSLNPEIVLGALVDVMVDNLNVDKCVVSLQLPGSDRIAIRASRNLAPETIARLLEMYEERREAGRVVLVQDLTVRDYEDLKSADIGSLVEAEGIRATLDAPIRTPEGVVGAFGIAYTSAHDFSAQELRLVRAIAERAGVAIQNAQLAEEARRRSRETEALLRADAELFRSLTLDEVLRALVDVAVDVLGVDKSVVLLHEGEVDVIRASRNFTPENIASFNKVLSTMPHEEPPPETQRTVVYADIAEAPAFIAEMLGKEDVTSHMSVPVCDAERTLGVFGLSFREEHVFTDEEQRLYKALADRAAVAIKNAELYERAQQVASLEERQRLARELHDSVSQALFGIALGAQTARLRIDNDPATAAEPIEYVMSLAQAGLAEMRALIFELRPESLENEGLVAALEKQVAAMQARHSLSITMELMDEPACKLDVKEALYRISQEALHNIVKHAQATNVEIRLEREGDDLCLTIKDDGRGFDAKATYPGHVGLLSMPERAARLGGEVEIESEVGVGTRVTARLPA